MLSLEPFIKPRIAQVLKRIDTGQLNIVECPVKNGCICSAPTHENVFKQKLHNAWSSFLSGVWCINLLDREDRFLTACDEMHRVGLCKLVRFHRCPKARPDEVVRAGYPQYMDNPGHFGCWRSHRSIVCNLNNKGGLTLILEDDVVFNTKMLRPHYIVSIGRYLLQNKHLDMFYLGHIAFGGGYPTTMLDNNLIVCQVKSVLAHAYILTPQGTQKVIEYGKFGANNQMAIDQWFKQNMTQEAIFPQLATQSGSPSGINQSTNQTDKAFVFYTQYHVWLDILFCWVVPVGLWIGLPIMSLVTVLALLLQSLKLFLICLLFITIFIILGIVVLSISANQLQNH